MTLCYKQVCDLLKRVVPAVTVVPYSIDSKVKWENTELKGKVEYKYKNWKQHHPQTELKDRGSCEIGHFTGNELLGVFTGIFTNYNDKWQVGDCLCLTVQGKQCAVILFYQSRPMVITSSPPADHQEWRFMFSKLFDDKSVDRSQKGPHEKYFKEEVISDFRKNAKREYFNFLNKKFSEFPLFPFGLPFLGLTIDIAFQSSENEPLRSANPEFADIPFAACVKLAFDADQSGKITDLFGERSGPKDGKSEELKTAREKRADRAINTAKELIMPSIPPNEE